MEDYFAIWDEDPGDESYKPDKDFLPDALVNNKGLEITENLESFLNISSSDDSEKVKNAHKWALDINPNEIPTEFQRLQDFLDTETVGVDSNEELEKTELPNSDDDIPF